MYFLFENDGIWFKRTFSLMTVLIDSKQSTDVTSNINNDNSSSVIDSIFFCGSSYLQVFSWPCEKRKETRICVLEVKRVELVHR